MHGNQSVVCMCDPSGGKAEQIDRRDRIQHRWLGMTDTSTMQQFHCAAGEGISRSSKVSLFGLPVVAFSLCVFTWSFLSVCLCVKYHCLGLY